jgi:general secretion pathway protein G
MRNARQLRRPPSRIAQAGMTLIEIIVVIVLIGGVIAVVGNQVINNSNRAKVKLAGVQVQKVGTCLESYNGDVGEYPQQLQDLVEDPGTNGWLGPYCQKSDLKDPFGKDMQYTVPGEDGPFDLISYGKDGKPGGSAVDADIVYAP